MTTKTDAARECAEEIAQRFDSWVSPDVILEIVSKHFPPSVPPEKLIAAIPTSWLDPLLSGPNAVMGKTPWGCPQVARLLRAIKARMEALIEEAK